MFNDIHPAFLLAVSFFALHVKGYSVSSSPLHRPLNEFRLTYFGVNVGALAPGEEAPDFCGSGKTENKSRKINK